MNAHSARAHAKLSPSSAHRWIECPGSVRMSEGIDEKSSVFADEGTAAHTLAELCLREGAEPADFLGGHVDVNTGKVSRAAGEGERVYPIVDEMVDAVSLYVDTVRGMVGEGDEVEYEARLDLRHIPGMAFGTGDCVIYKPATRHLIIADLKYGKGVPVDAENNPQTRAYALGASQRFHNRGVDTIESVIVQPRCPHPAGVVRRETIDVLDLVEFRIELEAAAAATAEPDAPLNPGEWCRFCPAAATCPALRQKVLETAEMEFAEPSDVGALAPDQFVDVDTGLVVRPPPVSTLTADDMALVLKQAGVLKDWLKRVEERAHQMARDGEPPTGFKLVASRATRRWLNEDEAITRFTNVLGLSDEQIYVEPTVRSPAQIEKIIGTKRKAEIADLIVAKSSGTILVPTEDPRPSVKSDAEEEFA